jgi:hypothetical protein
MTVSSGHRNTGGGEDAHSPIPGRPPGRLPGTPAHRLHPEFLDRLLDTDYFGQDEPLAPIYELDDTI